MSLEQLKKLKEDYNNNFKKIINDKMAELEEKFGITNFSLNGYNEGNNEGGNSFSGTIELKVTKGQNSSWFDIDDDFSKHFTATKEEELEIYKFFDYLFNYHRDDLGYDEDNYRIESV